MRCFLSVFAVLGWLGSFPLSSHAQVQDFVIEVGEVIFDTTADVVWVNRAQCDLQAEVDLIVSLAVPAGIENFVFVGGANVDCALNSNRNNDPPLCGEPTGSPFQVDPDNLITVPLSALTGTGFVDCENQALTGTPYTLFDFRDNAPGSQNITDGFGTANFTVDVTGPLPVAINTSAQTGSRFNLSWTPPSEQRILRYQVFQNLVDDPDTATAIDGVTAGQNASSVSVSASAVTLNEDDSAFLFVQAIDQAENPGALSAGVPVTAIPTEGFCTASGECDGCSATRLSPSDAALTWGLLAVLALLGLVCVRRLVR